jgi:hypothetical protein
MVAESQLQQEGLTSTPSISSRVTLMCRRALCLSSPFDATSVIVDEEGKSEGLDFEDWACVNISGVHGGVMTLVGGMNPRQATEPGSFSKPSGLAMPLNPA